MKMPTFDAASHVYSLDGRRIPSVTKILRDGGVVCDKYFTEEARIRGSLVHRIVLLETQKDLDEESIDPRPEIQGRYLAWKEFRKVSGYAPLYSEKLVYSHSADYAGTFDSYGWMNGRLVMLDYKTGVVPSWAGMQLQAYIFAAVECGIERPLRAYCLQLKPTGKFHLEPFRNDVIDRARFFECLAKSRGLASV